MQNLPGESMPEDLDRVMQSQLSEPIYSDINIQTLNYSAHSIMYGAEEVCTIPCMSNPENPPGY